MRAWVALTLFVLTLLWGLSRYDPEAHNRVLIDAVQIQVAQPNTFMLCEMRELAGPQHTLNPHAPRHERVQERIKICVEVLRDGRRPRSGGTILSIRKEVTSA